MRSQFNVPWHHVDHLTLSFVPDGTSVAGVTSGLFRTLDGRQPTTDWQREILRAFQTWAVEADINVALAPDGGQPLGTPGPDQGDSRFGDIRIGAQPMSPEVLAVSVPHDPFLSGTWSGDILLNDTSPAIGPADTLFPVLLHEVGHILGFDHSDDPASVLAPRLNPDRTTLASSDISEVRALYGTRGDDPYEGVSGNETLAKAAPMPEPVGYDGTTPLLFYASLSTDDDIDTYTLRIPVGYSGPLTARLQTAGVSLLEPRLRVLDAGGQILGDLSSTALGGDTLQVHLPDVHPGETYTIQVLGASHNIFGLGEYVMAASFDARSTVGPDEIDRLARQSYSYLSPDDIRAIFLDPIGALFHVDAPTNDSFATAEDLDPAGVYGSEAPDRITASLSDPTDVDVYHIETPREYRYAGGGSPLVMTATVRATEVNGIMPSIAVFDSNQHPVPAQVLAHGDGTFAIQVAAVRPDADYFIRVDSDRTSSKMVGNYDLDVEYGHTAAAPVTFLDGSLDGSGRPSTFNLVVNQTQLFDLLLTAGVPGAPDRGYLRMALTDGQGRTIVERDVPAGETLGGDPVLLTPGIYRVTFAVVGDRPAASSGMAFRLYGSSLTDPIGPALDDSTLRPMAVKATGDRSVAPLPILNSEGAPYYWLALGLGGRGAIGSDEARAFASFGVGQTIAPGPAFASLSGLGRGPGELSNMLESLTGILPAWNPDGGRPLTTHVPPATILVATSSGLPSLDPGYPGTMDPTDPGTVTGLIGIPDEIARVSPVIDSRMVLASARISAPDPSIVPIDVPATSDGEGDPEPTAITPDAGRDETRVGPDLVQTVAVLGTAALIYSRLHAGSPGLRIGAPARPVRARSRFVRPSGVRPNVLRHD